MNGRPRGRRAGSPRNIGRFDGYLVGRNSEGSRRLGWQPSRRQAAFPGAIQSSSGGTGNLERMHRDVTSYLLSLWYSPLYATILAATFMIDAAILADQIEPL